MSGKLDKSLDEILSTQRGRGRPQRRAASAAKPAPVGGVQKNPKRAGAAAKPAPAKAAARLGDSKIVVSNMPRDVTEAQIKEYFGQSVGAVKRVEVSYGRGGESRGIATVTFARSDGASKAFSELNGLLIDGRPVKVEVIVSQADQIPQPKTLSQRATLPKAKAQPKSAANDKRAAKGAKGAAGAAGDAKGKKAPRKGRNSRPTKKTAEELDSEMADYFVAPATADNAAAGAPAAANNNGDAPMEDEIL